MGQFIGIYIGLWFISFPLTYFLFWLLYKLFGELCWSIGLSKNDKLFYKKLMEKEKSFTENEDEKVLRRYGFVKNKRSGENWYYYK